LESNAQIQDIAKKRHTLLKGATDMMEFDIFTPVFTDGP